MTFYKLNLLTSVEPFEKYEQVAKSKRKRYREILYGEKTSRSETYNKVKECYIEYEDNTEHLEKLVPFDGFAAIEKEALLHCYTGNTKLVRELRNEIIENQNIHYSTKCAYCGLGDTNYLDHYLPKDDFPEYAVHAHNLVPCCSYCNEKKSAQFLDRNNNRKIFNPYFEEVGEEPIIFCTLECLDTTVKSNLTMRQDIDNPVWLNHLSTLNIIKRYQNELPRILCSIMFDILINSEETGRNPEGFSRVIERKLRETEKIQGVNSLEAVVYRAYLEEEQLFEIEYLKKVYKNMTRKRVQRNR